MTKWGYRTLVGLLGGAAALFLIILSTSLWSERTTEMTCDEWFRNPEEGRFRLTECQLNLDAVEGDAEQHYRYFAPEAPVLVTPVAAEGDSSARLFYMVDERFVVDWMRARPSDPEASARFDERYGRQLHPVTTLEVSLSRQSQELSLIGELYPQRPDVDPFVANRLRRGLPVGAFFLLPAFLALLLLGMVVVANRRWQRAHPTRPKTF